MLRSAFVVYKCARRIDWRSVHSAALNSALTGVRSVSIRCALCVVGCVSCYAPNCPRTYHVACARPSGCVFVGSFTAVYCSAHASLAKKHGGRDLIFQVEKILKSRGSNDSNKRHKQYLVKWQGYEEMADCTWEPASSFLDSDVIASFERAQAGRKDSQKAAASAKEQASVARLNKIYEKTAAAASKKASASSSPPPVASAASSSDLQGELGSPLVCGVSEGAGSAIVSVSATPSARPSPSLNGLGMEFASDVPASLAHTALPPAIPLTPLPDDASHTALTPHPLQPQQQSQPPRKRKRGGSGGTAEANQQDSDEPKDSLTTAAAAAQSASLFNSPEEPAATAIATNASTDVVPAAASSPSSAASAAAASSAASDVAYVSKRLRGGDGPLFALLMPPPRKSYNKERPSKKRQAQQQQQAAETARAAQQQSDTSMALAPLADGTVTAASSSSSAAASSSSPAAAAASNSSPSKGGDVIFVTLAKAPPRPRHSIEQRKQQPQSAKATAAPDATPPLHSPASMQVFRSLPDLSGPPPRFGSPGDAFSKPAQKQPAAAGSVDDSGGAGANGDAHMLDGDASVAGEARSRADSPSMADSPRHTHVRSISSLSVREPASGTTHSTAAGAGAPLVATGSGSGSVVGSSATTRPHNIAYSREMKRLAIFHEPALVMMQTPLGGITSAHAAAPGAAQTGEQLGDARDRFVLHFRAVPPAPDAPADAPKPYRMVGFRVIPPHQPMSYAPRSAPVVLLPCPVCGHSCQDVQGLFRHHRRAHASLPKPDAQALRQRVIDEAVAQGKDPYVRSTARAVPKRISTLRAEETMAGAPESADPSITSEDEDEEAEQQGDRTGPLHNTNGTLSGKDSEFAPKLHVSGADALKSHRKRPHHLDPATLDSPSTHACALSGSNHLLALATLANSNSMDDEGQKQHRPSQERQTHKKLAPTRPIEPPRLSTTAAPRQSAAPTQPIPPLSSSKTVPTIGFPAVAPLPMIQPSYETMPPPEIGMDVTTQAYSNWYWQRGPGSAPTHITAKEMYDTSGRLPVRDVNQNRLINAGPQHNFLLNSNGSVPGGPVAGAVAPQPSLQYPQQQLLLPPSQYLPAPLPFLGGGPPIAPMMPGGMIPMALPNWPVDPKLTANPSANSNSTSNSGGNNGGGNPIPKPGRKPGRPKKPVSSTTASPSHSQQTQQQLAQNPSMRPLDLMQIQMPMQMPMTMPMMPLPLPPMLPLPLPPQPQPPQSQLLAPDSLMMMQLQAEYHKQQTLNQQNQTKLKSGESQGQTVAAAGTTVATSSSAAVSKSTTSPQLTASAPTAAGSVSVPSQPSTPLRNSMPVSSSATATGTGAATPTAPSATSSSLTSTASSSSSGGVGGLSLSSQNLGMMQQQLAYYSAYPSQPCFFPGSYNPAAASYYPYGLGMIGSGYGGWGPAAAYPMMGANASVGPAYFPTQPSAPLATAPAAPQQSAASASAAVSARPAGSSGSAFAAPQPPSIAAAPSSVHAEGPLATAAVAESASTGGVASSSISATQPLVQPSSVVGDTRSTAAILVSSPTVSDAAPPSAFAGSSIAALSSGGTLLTLDSTKLAAVPSTVAATAPSLSTIETSSAAVMRPAPRLLSAPSLILPPAPAAGDVAGGVQESSAAAPSTDAPARTSSLRRVSSNSVAEDTDAVASMSVVRSAPASVAEAPATVAAAARDRSELLVSPSVHSEAALAHAFEPPLPPALASSLPPRFPAADDTHSVVRTHAPVATTVRSHATAAERSGCTPSPPASPLAEADGGDAASAATSHLPPEHSLSLPQSQHDATTVASAVSDGTFHHRARLFPSVSSPRLLAHGVDVSGVGAVSDDSESSPQSETDPAAHPESELHSETHNMHSDIMRDAGSWEAIQPLG